MAAARDQVVRKFDETSDGTLRGAPVEALRTKSDETPKPEIVAAIPAPAKSGRKRKIFIGVGLLAFIAASIYGVQYYLVGRYFVSTDDAYVRANNSTLGARVSGHIAEIVARDNTRVNAGDVVFRIDDGDYKIAVESARARIATQDATITRIGRQVFAQNAAVEQAQAQLSSAEAGATRAQLDFERQQALNTKGFASRATFEGSQAGRDQGAAGVQSARAAVESAQASVEVTKAQQQEAQRQRAEYQASLEKAERDLAFTQVRAAVAGVFSNRIVNTGDFVNAGQRLANIVPLDEVFIDANFKETQLARLVPGQPVAIKVDAYTSRTIEGTVDSVSPAAGAVFTLLPPDNATGNFTKIVQRIPVRVRVPADVAKENRLRPGMSVYTTIDTRETR